jgi:hypothetical protein
LDFATKIFAPRLPLSSYADACFEYQNYSFDEVNHWHNCVAMKILQATFELYVLPGQNCVGQKIGVSTSSILWS